MDPTPLAAQLNDTIRDVNPHIHALLSTKGRSAFFPAKGILAQTAQAKGRRINATIGMAFEEDGSIMHLPALASKVSLPAADIFPYATSYGKKELRETWLRMMKEKNPSLEGKQVSLPIVTNALTHGLYIAMELLVDPGDDVILPDLFWGNYKLIFTHGFDARLQTFTTFTNEAFNIEGLRQALVSRTSDTIVCVLNFPNNPSGYTPTQHEAHQLTQVLIDAADSGKTIAVVCDDAYFGLAYEPDLMKESFFAAIADAHERILAVKIDGPTKEDYVWGFRVGFVTFGCRGANQDVYDALQAKCAGMVRGSISNACHLSQSLLLSAYTDPDYARQKREKFETMNARYHRVRQILDAHPEYAEAFVALPFNSGYFMCVRLVQADAHAVRETLLDKYDTGVIATGSLIRIAFASCPGDALEELFDNLYRACNDVT